MLCPGEPDKTIALQSLLATTPGITALGGWKVHHQTSPQCFCEIPLSQCLILRCEEKHFITYLSWPICPVGCNRSAGSASSDLERVRTSLLWCPKCLPLMPHPSLCTLPVYTNLAILQIRNPPLILIMTSFSHHPWYSIGSS